jgi:hypothetical protein
VGWKGRREGERERERERRSQKETDDGGKIEINPNSVWWSGCFYLTFVVVKIIGKEEKSWSCS